MDIDEKSRYFKITRTLFSMLRDRGYFVTEEMSKETLEEFREKPESEWEWMMFPNKEGQSILVLFSKKDKIKKEDIQEFGIEMIKKCVPKGILIAKSSITNESLELVQTIQEIQIELFLENELIVNITEHEMVPKHILITTKEKTDLLKKYNVREAQLPRMLTTDPVSRYLGLRRGQVVKIIRNSETAGKYVTYRIVY